MAAAWYPDPVLVGRKRLAGGRGSSAAVVRMVTGPVVWFNVATATYLMVEHTAASIRQKKNDHWNGVYGGMSLGVVMGVMARRFDVMVPGGLAMGMAMGALAMSESSIRAHQKRNKEYAARLKEERNGTDPSTLEMMTSKVLQIWEAGK